MPPPKRTHATREILPPYLYNPNLHADDLHATLIRAHAGISLRATDPTLPTRTHEDLTGYAVPRPTDPSATPRSAGTFAMQLSQRPSAGSGRLLLNTRTTRRAPLRRSVNREVSIGHARARQPRCPEPIDQRTLRTSDQAVLRRR